MRSVRKNFRLDDRNQSILLADGGILGQPSGVFSDGFVSGASVSDLKDSSPLGKPASNFVELSSHVVELLDALGIVFFFPVREDGQAFVHLDSSHDSFALQQFDEVGSVSGGLSGGLFVEDDSRNVILETFGGQQHISVPPSVFLVVLQAERLELFLNGAGRLISSEDSLARSADFVGSFDEFLGVVLGFHIRNIFVIIREPNSYLYYVSN